MIKPGEIQKIAAAAGVKDPQIEKEYMLSRIFKGISQYKELSDFLVFKDQKLIRF